MITLMLEKEKKEAQKRMRNLKTAQAVYIYINKILEEKQGKKTPLFLIEKGRLLF